MSDSDSSTEAMQEYVGLTFTPTTIIASWFSESGSLELERRYVTPELRDYYHDMVRWRAQNNENCRLRAAEQDSMEVIFANAIAPLTKTLTARLGHAPFYKTLFLPSIFDHTFNYASIVALRNTNHNESIRDGSCDQALCSAWGFYEGQNLGRSPETCYEDGVESVVLVLEYEKDYLLAHMNHVYMDLKPIFASSAKSFDKFLGQNWVKFMDEGDYHDRLRAFINNFVQNEILPRVARDDIRAIIIGGEVSPERVTKLGEIAREAIGGDIVKVLTDVEDATIVAARGAAERARQLAQREREPYFSCTTPFTIPYDDEVVSDGDSVTEIESAQTKQEKIKKRDITPLVGWQDRGPGRANVQTLI